MRRVQRDAFVLSPQMHERVRRLNQAVHDRELLFVLAPDGSGKDRFFDWWWQEGCSDAAINGNMQLDSHELVLITMVPPPSSSVPPVSVLFTKLWDALKELVCAASTGQRPQLTGKTRSWITDGQVLTLVHKYVNPLVSELEPQAFVILNGEYLDKRCWPYLLELRSPIQRGRPRLAQRALIVCASVDPAEAGDSKFGKMVNEVKELRAAWPNRLEIGLMDVDEFVPVMLTLIRRNLNTIFGKDVDQDAILQEAAAWTQAEWRLTTEQLLPIVDQELGTAGNEPRVLTKKVWDRVRTRWQKRRS